LATRKKSKTTVSSKAKKLKKGKSPPLAIVISIGPVKPPLPKNKTKKKKRSKA
jgi:hypothetical protein